MADTTAPSGTVTAVADLAIGDGLYSDASNSAYWVTEISSTHVVLVTADDTTYRWLRETLNASFAAHTWTRQSTQPVAVDESSPGGATS